MSENIPQKLNKSDSTSLGTEENRADHEYYSVLVKNLQRTPDLEKTLTEFFSFCGDIAAISIVDDSSDSNLATAVITFNEHAAAKTAVLLTGTQINNRVIGVEFVHHPKPNVSSSSPSPNTTMPQVHVPEKIVETVNTLVGIGNEIVASASNVAKEIDEKIHISEKIGSVVHEIDENVKHLDQEYHVSEQAAEIGQNLKNKANEIDETYHITNNVQLVGSTIKEKISQIDEEHHVTERATEVANEVVAGVETSVRQVTEFLNTNETAKSGVEFISGVSESVGNAINNLWSSWTSPPTQPTTTPQTSTTI